ncbi:cornifelin-like [Melanotaenia boesemani]|uniref:cornifelin-like n=1 Tax=Melanotaenia boesemani TaxID=1250792 RepID=UPI001C0566A2|nr:cornifelin-like [Melanotaenia boesemani]
MAEKPQTEWSSGLGDCFEDASTCCYGFWCGPCLTCTVSGRFGENSCLPLCDILPSAMTLLWTPLIVPPAALSVRAAMRNRYGIKGSLWKDIAISCCCSWCSWCQMHRELKHRMKVPVVINMQPQTIVNMPPQTLVSMQPQALVSMQPQALYSMQPNPVMMPANVCTAGFVSQPGVAMPPE